MTQALKSAPQDGAVDAFIADGFYTFGEVLPRYACEALMHAVEASREFGPDIFLSQEAFEADPQFKGVNPQPGRNLLQSLAPLSDFILADPAIRGPVADVLGADFEVLDSKFVCGVPERWLPEWLAPRIRGNPVNNLGAYIKPEYRDITYFYGIDFHQDIIDWKSRTADFLTLYVYIHPVTAGDAPLYVIPGTHALGATLFPHDLVPDSRHKGHWRYSDGMGRSVDVQDMMLTGGMGYAAMWHSFTLHGTQPVSSDSERFSARYILTRGRAATTGMDAVNATIDGPLSLDETRRDLDAHGAAQIKANAIITRPE